MDLSLPVLLDDPILNKIAAKYNRSPAEVAMRFILQKGIVVLAKSFNPNRIKQNLGVTTASYYVVLNYLLWDEIYCENNRIETILMFW